MVGAVTLQPDDIVDGGGNTFTETWTVNKSGTSEHPIIIRNAIINSQTARSYGLSTNSNSYLTFSNLTIKDSNFKNMNVSGSSYITIDHYSSSGKGAAIYTESSSHITITNLISTITNTGYNGALSFNAPGTDVSITTATISGSNSRGIYSTITSNVTLDDVEVTSNGSAAGIEIKNMTSGNLLLSNIYSGVTRGGVSAGNTDNGLYLNNDDGILFNADGIYSKNNTYVGVRFVGCSLVQDSILKNFNISNNASSGIWVGSTPNLTIQSGVTNYNTSSSGIYIDGPSQSNVVTGVTMNHNGGDGLVATNGVLGLVVKYSEASYNGTVGGSSSGDGYSLHDTSTGNFYYVKAISNLNTGMAHVGASSGSIYNSLIINNGSPSDPDKNRAGLCLTTTANPGFIVKNNIVSGNYPVEIMEGLTPYNVFDYNLYNPLDNNKFYTPVDNSSLTSWADYHATRENHSLNTNPLFVDVSNNNFLLQANSPAINAGTDVGLTKDFVGTAVPQGSAPDIGAYEYVTSATSSTNGGSSSSSVNPNCPSGFKHCISAGPHAVGGSGSVTGDDANLGVQALMNSNVHHDDVYLTIAKQNTNTLMGNNISFPWAQGMNTASEIYNFTAVSAFNGYPIPTFDHPATVILSYDPAKLNGVSPDHLRIAWFDPTIKQWEILHDNSVINPQTHTIANTTTHFSYFTVVFESNNLEQDSSTVLGVSTSSDVSLKPTPTSISTLSPTPINQKPTSQSPPKSKFCILWWCF